MRMLTKSIGIILQVCVCCAASMEARESIAVEKNYTQCSKEAYGRSELSVAPLDIFDVKHVSQGIVPVVQVGPIRNMKFKNHMFTIEHTGTYQIDYFFKALSYIPEIMELGAPLTLDIAVKINDRFVGYRKCNGFVGIGGLWFTCNGTILENLTKGDKISLWVVKIPAFEIDVALNAPVMKRDDMELGSVVWFNFEEPNDKGAHLVLTKIAKSK